MSNRGLFGSDPRGALAPLLLGALFSASLVLAASFGGCAKGNNTSSGGSAGSHSGATAGAGGGTGGAAGGIGLPCATEQDCPEGGACIEIAGKKVCTQACPPACPDGSYCTLVQGDPYCVADSDQQCGQCLGAAQCKGITDECLTAPAGDKFCGRDCTVMDDCPTGFICMDSADYAALSAGTGGAAGSGGGGAGGAAGGAGGATGGGGPSLPDAGGKPPAGKPHKFCVPPDEKSCPCNDKRDGVSKSCDIKNDLGKCPGSETCAGKDGAWVGCTAKTPAAETCNAGDDDCNGSVDDGDPNALCGGSPPNGAYACNGGSCALGGCDPGWTQYPAGKPSDGCTCPMDASEPNDTCATPADAGTVSDAGGAVQITGTLSSDVDVDVWTIQTADVDEGTMNSYHVSIDLVPDVGADTFLVDVIRGDACVDAPSGGAVGITSYDWCVDGKSADGMIGESPCSIDGPIHCNDNSAKYFIRVYRKPGAPAACAGYKIAVSAKGGDACDFTQQCN